MISLNLPNIQNKNLGKIKYKIAIMSGKGGVGKSTVSALIALQFAKKGYKVGILDADITGSSIPKIFGLNDKPQVEEKKIIPPITSKGIKIMSMNLLLEKEDQPVIWRGPLIGNVLKQFLSDVRWDELDYLIIDLPPGTSDAPLTIMQTISLNGIVLVTSPQSLVNMIVKKALNMTHSLNVPLIGLIENMSWLICPHCNQKIELFGKSNAQEVAEKNGINFLGRIPLHPDVAKLCDEGKIEQYTNSDVKQIVEKIESFLKNKNL